MTPNAPGERVVHIEFPSSLVVRKGARAIWCSNMDPAEDVCSVALVQIVSQIDSACLRTTPDDSKCIAGELVVHIEFPSNLVVRQGVRAIWCSKMDLMENVGSDVLVFQVAPLAQKMWAI